jgi:hypothetical protein
MAVTVPRLIPHITPDEQNIVLLGAFADYCKIAAHQEFDLDSAGEVMTLIHRRYPQFPILREHYIYNRLAYCNFQLINGVIDTRMLEIIIIYGSAACLRHAFSHSSQGVGSGNGQRRSKKRSKKRSRDLVAAAADDPPESVAHHFTPFGDP